MKQFIYIIKFDRINKSVFFVVGVILYLIYTQIHKYTTKTKIIQPQFYFFDNNNNKRKKEKKKEIIQNKF